MTLHYDLHSHSTASDGTLTPSELVAHAVKSGVNVLALTDHDTTKGIEEASLAASQTMLTLISGVEISVTWNNRTLHIVGLNMDINSPELQAGLATVLEFRNWRAHEISRRLAKRGINDAYEGALKYTNGDVISRTHYARFLVEQGYCKDVREVFKKYLVTGKPGHVAGEWATLENAVGWIIRAGGQAVIAHPARYKLTATKMRKLLGEFIECGGVGIEVISGSHSRDEYYTMANFARLHELYASAGSDYHGPINPWIELGRIPALPDGCKPIWELWDENQETQNISQVLE
ncbi:MAG: PHP domain-containing protein [Gammaproteobacteria bacterium]|nr:PHP domain-containing protein [Gammaproteobacteria bacterium]MDH5593043.1 PHP domain-containing protein [Gammaproteobacteria bacterium]